MRQLGPNWSRTAFPARIPPVKAFGMPNVHKLYYIPIKIRKKNADQINLGNFSTYHHPRGSRSHLVGVSELFGLNNEADIEIDLGNGKGVMGAAI